MDKIKLLKPDGSIIVRPKTALKEALKRGLRLIDQLPKEITSGEKTGKGVKTAATEDSTPSVVSPDVTASASDFEFNINRSANVVISELGTLTSDQLSVVLSLEESRKKPRKSVIKAIEKINE